MKTILFVEDELMLHDAVKGYYDSEQDISLIYHSFLNKAGEQIESHFNNHRKIDLLICDLRFPKNALNAKFVSGDRLISFFLEKFPDTPVCIISSNEMPAVISYHESRFKPKGYLLKSEINRDIFILAVETILKKDSYYSDIIYKYLHFAKENNMEFDATDKQILNKLSEGMMIKNMGGQIYNQENKPLKRRRIEEIIYDLRLALGAKNNVELIFKACKLGIINCCSG